MYTYPQALDAMEKILVDLFKAAGKKAQVHVVADPSTGTASVTWDHHSSTSLSCTVRFPVRPATTKITQAEFDDYVGYGFHETGHPLETDWATWTRAVNTGRSRLLNALEDVRIEKRMIDRKVAANGKAVLENLVRSLDYKASGEGFDPNDPRNIGFVMGFLGRHANGYDIEANRLTAKLRADSAVSKALVWALPALAKCNSTQDCLDLAERLLKALPKQDRPKQDKPKGERKTEPGQGGDAAEASEQEPQKGEGNAEGEAPDGDAEKSEGSQAGKGKQDDKPKQDEGKSGQGGAGEQPEEALTDRDVHEVDLTPKNGDEMKSNGYKDPGHVEASVINAIREANKAGNRALPKALQSQSVYDVAHVTQTAAKATRQRALLARALKRNEEDLYEGSLKHGKLDRRAFARMAAGSSNVMGRRETVDGYETDAVILVDGSGSMCCGNIQAAAPMALVIAQAAAQVGVACSTYIFGTSSGGNYATRPMHGLVEVKEGKGRPDATRFAQMIDDAGGGTPLSPAMLAVATRQMQRAPNKRRVLFVVSDGMCSAGPATLKATATYIEQALGTEIANIAIGMPLQGCFNNEVYVDPAGDIASVGLETLTRKLARGA